MNTLIGFNSRLPTGTILHMNGEGYGIDWLSGDRYWNVFRWVKLPTEWVMVELTVNS